MPEPIPVLLMTQSLGIGGSERQMAETLKSLDRAIFEPHAGCLRLGGIREQELRDAHIPILHIPVSSFGNRTALLGARQFFHYIRRNRIGLVHTFDVPLNVFAAPIAWLARRPVVLTSQRAHRGLTPGLYSHLLRFTDHVADGIVVNCEYMRRHLMEDENVPPAKIHLCYNGLDTEAFRPGPRPAHSELSGASVVIGVVCALRPEKGLSTLVAAFAAIAPRFPAARLLIVGSGPELSSLQQQAAENGIASQCVFVPTTSNVSEWLRAIDIFVLPSLSEAFSNSLMEAMCSGCCPVASNVGGNPELIGLSSRGELFPAGDAASLAVILAALIESPERRRSLAAAAGEFIRTHLSTAAAAQRMREIYSTVLAKKRTTGLNVH